MPIQNETIRNSTEQFTVGQRVHTDVGVPCEIVDNLPHPDAPTFVTIRYADGLVSTPRRDYVSATYTSAPPTPSPFQKVARS